MLTSFCAASGAPSPATAEAPLETPTATEAATQAVGPAQGSTAPAATEPRPPQAPALPARRWRLLDASPSARRRTINR